MEIGVMIGVVFFIVVLYLLLKKDAPATPAPPTGTPTPGTTPRQPSKFPRSDEELQ